jgi:hypothetical protein
MAGKAGRNGTQYHFIIRGLFDLYCTHGPNTTGRFEELAGKSGHFRVSETGWSKLDPLFDGSYSSGKSGWCFLDNQSFHSLRAYYCNSVFDY